MGHAGRYFRPGQPLPDDLGPAPGAVGFVLPSRFAGKVAGFFRTAMHGIEVDERGVAVTVVTGGARLCVCARVCCIPLGRAWQAQGSRQSWDPGVKGSRRAAPARPCHPPRQPRPV